MSKQLDRNLPLLRFKEFSERWEVKKLGEIGSFKNGLNKDKEDFGFGFPFVNLNDVFGKTSIDDNQSFGLVNANEKDLNIYNIKKGDVLFIRSSVKPIGVGETTVILNDLENTVYSGFLIRFREIIVLDLLFKKYCFWTNNFRKKLLSYSTTSANTNINQHSLSKLKLPIPSLPEQTKIATFLTSIDKRLQQLRERETLLQDYKTGCLQQIFSQHIRFKKDNGEDFEEWEFLHGNKIFDKISNKEHNSDLPILAISQELGAVPRELINYKISVTQKSVASYKVVEIGDFIISLRSFQGGIEYSNYKGICSPAYIILRPKVEIVDYFYKTYFKTHKYIQELQRKLEGIRDGKMISYKYFSEIKLPFPSIEEQQKIANFLSSIDTKITTVSEQIKQLEAYKRGLLQQMFV